MNEHDLHFYKNICIRLCYLIASLRFPPLFLKLHAKTAYIYRFQKPEGLKLSFAYYWCAFFRMTVRKRERKRETVKEKDK